jgi:hypothetical protein
MEIKNYTESYFNIIFDIVHKTILEQVHYLEMKLNGFLYYPNINVRVMEKYY